MQKDIWTKTVLTCIALLLAVLVVEQWTTNVMRVSAAAPAAKQAWEYKRIKWLNFDVKDGQFVTSDKWFEDGVEQKTGLELSKKFTELGSQGWELVVGIPTADTYPKFFPVIVGKSFGDNYEGNVGKDITNGTTTSVYLIFKRPKP
jgi:hypothetical protein